MCILLHLYAAILLRKAQSVVISVILNFLFEASAPQAVCSRSAKHLRLSDRGGVGRRERTDDSQQRKPWDCVGGTSSSFRGGTRSGCWESCVVGGKGLERSALLKSDCAGVSQRKLLHLCHKCRLTAGGRRDLKCAMLVLNQDNSLPFPRFMKGVKNPGRTVGSPSSFDMQQILHSDCKCFCWNSGS